MSTEKKNGSPEQNLDVQRRVIEEGFNKAIMLLWILFTQPITGNTSSG